ncbi:MAG: hypothetical protein P4L84_03040 [Isosphaeraceae bacterium]|nr:hypothetical protein [Isosphaeraceae bacterium]
MPRTAPAAILDGSYPYSRESPTISKRKPPSKRPERKLDDTAKAIARVQEDAKAKKSAESARSGSDESKVHMSQLRKGIGPVKAVGPVAAPSTKRPKKAGI